MRVAEHTFVITGGASGLGAATAQHLVAQGAAVVLLDINQSAVEAAAQRLGNKALGLACDICDAEQVQQALDAAVQQQGLWEITTDGIHLTDLGNQLLADRWIETYIRRV